MERAKETTEHETTNMAWAVLLGVFDVFRRRLDANQQLDFAATLPPTLRAIFIEFGAPNGPSKPFATREELTLEVQQVHRDHQFATETAIDDIARALGEFVDHVSFAKALDAIGADARADWSAALGDGSRE